MQKLFLLLIFFSSFITLVHAQTPTDAQLVKFVDSLLASQFSPGKPGCAVLIARKGEVIYKKSFGSANVELNVAMQPDMIFRIGSVTKQYTAIAILQLVEQGKISLQDSIQKFIKNFSYKEHTITIGNLLSHTSGIMDYENLDVHIPFSWRLDFPPKQIVDSLANHPLEFIPGSKFSYSNSNYFLLGYIIGLLTGKTYQEYLREHIFMPAMLTSTYYDDEKKIIPGRVQGYFLSDSGKYENAEFIGISQAYAGGGLMSDVGDLYKWHQALYSGQLVKKETLQDASRPYKLSDGSFTKYGYGWFINPTDGIRSIEHGGRIEGFRGNEMYLPDEDIFIATLFNSENDMALLLANTIAFRAIGKHLLQSATIKNSNQDDYTGTYQLASSPKRTIVIAKEYQQLFIQFSKGVNVTLIAQTDGSFVIQGVQPAATLLFVRENDKITKLVISQNGLFEWKKIK